MDGLGAKDFGGVKLRMRRWVFSNHPKYLDLVLIYLSDLMISITNLRLLRHAPFEDS